MKILSRSNLTLALIFLLAAFFRFYNINWDSGHQMHPDERAIVMTVDRLEFPDSLSEFLSPQSSWNPQFFAYGSFPMYLLKVTGDAVNNFNSSYDNYTPITLIGRFISALFDLITVFLLYKITRKLFNAATGLFAAIFYSISVLPIQLSHFFAVDTILTCFILATLYFLIRFYEKPSARSALVVGLFFGLSLATKISASVLIASIGLALTADFILIFLKNPHRPKHWLPHLPRSIKHLLKYAFAIAVSTLFTFIFFEPYAVIDFATFWQQTTQQSELTINPFYFPYTLQFVSKIPYIYEFKNIFLWGLGPVISIFAFAGTAYFAFRLFGKDRNTQFAKELILFTFFFVYILIVGKFAVGFMRYMLPVYPLFALFAAVLVYKLILMLNSQIKNKLILNTLYLILATSLLVWPLSFMEIYARPNTRIMASYWIYNNVPLNKTVAVEHWDDQLPIGQPISYNTQILKLYEPDTKEKWEEVNKQLATTDYIIIASNRLYAPLQSLTDCKKLPSYRCYPKTAEYYQRLFSGNLGFEKVAEFTSYPTIPIANLRINDQGADENFTVFDHPKIMIFQKTR
ncbi:MAG TPA: glycosyltransferase family 39 protein [Xanthomonadales bacterium]|nr:glycosyltransferase family 39 protein [Xanthomonadales bacterium]